MTKNSRVGHSVSHYPILPALAVVAALIVFHAVGRQASQQVAAQTLAPQVFGAEDSGTQPSYRINGQFLLSLLPYLTAIIFLSGLYLRLTFKLRRAAARDATADPQSGVSVVEFILVFPLLLALMLSILQLALLVQAKFVVNYAAFCAVRSAIVTIPARIRSGRRLEERNVIDTRDPDSPKMKIIRRAAALPCTAISPVWRPGLVISTGTSGDLAAVAPLSRLTVFAPSFDYERQILSRAVYAYDHRNTTVGVTSDGKDHGPVTVKVTHRYYLTVPFANRIFGRNYFGGWLVIFGFRSAWYYPITEQYTLLNEGEPPYPDSQKARFGNTDVEIERY